MAKLNELIENNESGSEKVKIKRFKDEIYIGEHAFKSFVEKYYDKDKGCYLSESNKTYGVISNCMGLSTMISLSDYKFDISTQFDIVLHLFKLVYEDVYKGSDYCFNAKPYINSNSISTFVETASKVAVTMSDMRNYLLGSNEIKITKDYKLNNDTISTKDELLQKVEELLIDAIRCLNESCLKCEEELVYTINGETVPRGDLGNKIDFKGWAYENVNGEDGEYAPSLYTTFHATNVYMNIYLYMGNLLDERYDKVSFQTVGMNPDELKLLNTNREFIEKNSKIFDDFFRRVVSAGRYLDYKIKKNNINLANFYINKNIEPVSFDDICSTQRSNDVINTLLAIHILLNSGVEIGYENLSTEAHDLIKSYREELQFSLNNVKKIYLLLKKESKEDIIDKFSILFDEKCPKEKLVTNKEYRTNCLNISPYDLVPLYCNAYANISKYLVQYPQKEMTENLEMTLGNSIPNEWIWPKEGFEINNNAYYLFSIYNFYDYYYEYELPLSEYGEKYNEKAKKAEDDLSAKTKTFTELQEKYEELKKEYDQKQSDLDKEVIKIVNKTCAEIVNDSIASYFNEMIADCRDLALEVVEGKANLGNSYSLGEDALNNKHSKAAMLLKMSKSNNFDEIIKKLGDSIYSDKKRFINRFDAELIEIIRKEIGS